MLTIPTSLEPMTPAQREEFRAELLRQIRSVDPAIFAEAVTTSPAAALERYLARNLPRWHQTLTAMNLLGEWCLAAQARYEERRQELLAQGLDLSAAHQLASAEELRPQSEEDMQEEIATTSTDSREDQESFSRILPRLLGELSRGPQEP